MAINPFWIGNPSSIGQQTLAGQIIAAGAGNGARPARRRKSRGTKRASARKVARKPRAKKARLVKGSAAAKAHMARIRRKRK